MKVRHIALLALLLSYISPSFAGAGNPCSKTKGSHVAKTTLADPAENNYDVNYLKFKLQVSDTSLFVRGDVATTAKVVVSSMGTYVFELDTLMTIDSAKFNGSPVSVTTSGNVRTITLLSSLPINTYFTAEIFYHGYPPTSGAAFFNGLTHAVTPGGSDVLYSVSDPYVAMAWWPAKQCIDDKIDSVDMYVTVPAHVVDGSNGVLVSVDTTSTPGYWKYHWQTHYPIDYYLISIAVAKYAQYKSYWHFTGSTDSVLIHDFFLDTATFNVSSKPNFDSVGMIIDYFSSLFGRYPFWQEKYGVCYTTLPGGMEHQTMTTIGVPNTYIIAHELCHQWFGDHVTYRTWGDVWLSEGFATFSEQLFYTHFNSPAAGLQHRQLLQNYALGDPCGMLYVNDTSTSDSLFNYYTVYAKGQAVIRTLQYLAPNDSVFFSVLKTYQQNFAFGLASTADLKALAEAAYGFPLDTFFNQWVYGRGFPKYRTYWDQVGTTVYLKLVQIASCPTYTPLFSTPLEIQLHGTGVDTFIKVYNSLDTQFYTFEWGSTMTSVILNPDVWTLCQPYYYSHDHTLTAGQLLAENASIYPNPTHNFWVVDNLPEGQELILVDMSGKIVWQGVSKQGPNVVPGTGLAEGIYYLKLSGEEKIPGMKLVRY